jgi:hypothetical protein
MAVRCCSPTRTRSRSLAAPTQGIAKPARRKTVSSETTNIGSHFDANGRTGNNAGTAAKPASYCYSAGHAYFCIRGQEAWCAANAPSGTTADNTGWGYAWDQGAASVSVPQWAGAMTWRAGGPILQDGANNASSFEGVHIEANGYSQLDQGCHLSGAIGFAVRVNAGVLSRNRVNTVVCSSEGRVLGGNLAVRGDTSLSGANIFGPYRAADAAVDGSTIFASRNTGHGHNFVAYDGAGVGTSYMLFSFGAGFGVSYDMVSGANFFRWKIGGTERFKVDASGANVANGAYFVGGIQVVGARNTGWAADTGTAEKTAHATYTGGTANAAYNQAEITAIRNALQDVSRGQKAIKDAMIAHGLTGA